MSRVGRQAIAIPAGVSVEIGANTVKVKGPLGELSRDIEKIVSVKIEGNEVVVSRHNDLNESKAKHGLYRQLIANMVEGVSKGFSKSLVINGVGYKLNQSGDKIIMNIGFSHPVEIVPTVGIKLTAKGDKEVVVSGIDKEKVGQFAAKIRDIKKVEPYHAYGIRYIDEVVVKKQGKTSGKK
ncbi:MAG: 50S ribosomal protein L6 [Christensenellaceae bacterium]|jgi:large subunit ribosomal protein L6|nr:50S ribosomal protein L6 [Christensenellaceae bacterium]